MMGVLVRVGVRVGVRVAVAVAVPVSTGVGVAVPRVMACSGEADTMLVMPSAV